MLDKFCCRHTVRFTFASPSNLTAHLAQATVSVASIPQLTQILIDEIERSLLNQICDTGTQLCGGSNGTWFVDEMMCRAVGRWEGCALYVFSWIERAAHLLTDVNRTFRVKCANDLTLDCHSIVSSRSLPPEAVTSKSTGFTQSAPSSVPYRLVSFRKREDTTLDFFSWVQRLINDALSLTP